MDFYAMKRKKLQTLCKKHGIPANLKNKEMAERLSLIFNKGKENQVSSQLGCSDNAGLEKRNICGKSTFNVEIIDLVSPSPGSANHSKSSAIEVEICGFEENMESELNKEQVDVICSEEFGNPLGDNNDVHGTEDDGVPDQISQPYAQTEVKSSDTHQTVASGTAAENADSCEMKSLSSQKMSLSLEERADSSPKHVKNSEIKRSEIKTNLSLERSDDENGNFYVKVNLHPASSALIMEDKSIVKVASEEFDNCSVEGEKVEKLPCGTYAHEDNCGSGKGGAESVKQDGTNSLECSIMNNNVNLSHVSPEESGYCVAEGESHELDNNICVHGSVPNVRNSGSEASKMCLDASIGAKYTDGDWKTNGIDKRFLDEFYSSSFNGSDWTPVQLFPTYAPGEKKSSDLNIHKGTATRNANTCEAKFVSSIKKSLSPASERISVFPPKLISNSGTKVLRSETKFSVEAPCFDTGMYDAEENTQIDVIKEQAKNCLEVLDAAPSVMFMNDGNLEKVALEEFGNYLVEGEVKKLGDRTDLFKGVRANGKIGDEEIEQGDNNSPQVSNMSLEIEVETCDFKENMRIELNNKQVDVVASEEFIGHFDDNIDAHGTENDGAEGEKQDNGNSPHESRKTVLNDLPDSTEEIHKSDGEKTDVTREPSPDQILQPYARTEVKSSDTQLTFASGAAAENADSCEMNFLSSQKMSLSPEGKIDSSPELLKSSEVKRLKINENLSENFHVKENIQRDVSKEVLHHPALDALVMDDESIIKVASEEFESCLVEDEVEKLSNQTYVHEDTYRTEKSEAETEKQDDTNSPQGSSMNNVSLLHVSPKEPVDRVAEGECHQLDSNICVHGSVSDVRNSESDAVKMCLDATLCANYSDGKGDVTVEHILDEVHSSSSKDLDGTPVQHPPTHASSEVKSSELSNHKTAVSGTATKNGDACDAKFVSSGNKSLSPASEKIIGFSPKLITNSDIKVLQSGTNILSDAPRFDIGTCDVEEEIQIDVIKEQAKNCLEVLDAASSVMFMNDGNVEKVASQEFGNHLVEEVQKSKDSIFYDAAYNLRVNGTEGNALGLFETSIAAEDIDGKSNVAMEYFSDDVPSSGIKYSDGTSDQFLRSYPRGEVKSSCLNIHQMVTSDTSEEKLKSLQKIGQFSDPKECVEFSRNNLEALDIKGLQAETNFDPSTLGDVAGTSKMKESMQSDNMEKEYNQGTFYSTKNAIITNNADHLQSYMEECYTMSGVVTGLFDERDVSDDTGDIVSHKRLKRETVSREKCFLNDFQSVDNAGGQNSDEKPDESAPTVSHSDEMRSSYSNLHENFASDTSEEKLRSSKETCQIANPNGCIGFSPDNNHEASEIKGFQAETDFEPSALGDLVGTCHMEGNKMDTEFIQEVFHSTKDDVVLNSVNLLESSVEKCYSVPGEVTGVSDNHIVHDDAGAARAEEENETYMVSSKRLKREMDSLEKYFASDTAGDECVYQGKLESPPKCTPIPSSEESISFLPNFLGSSMMKKELKNETNLPLKPARNILGTSDMKENIKSAKKEQVGSITSKNTFPKRQPLQDLQQNRTLEPL